MRDMINMFNGASSFNQPLNNWNVSNVDDMGRVFDGATSFNQPLHAPWYRPTPPSGFSDSGFSDSEFSDSDH